MTGLAVDALLALAVIALWVGCIGFARLGSAFDRVHCAAFVNAAAGTAVAAAAFVADGPSNRAFKILLVLAVSLVTGAAQSHAIGRALQVRAGRPGA